MPGANQGAQCPFCKGSINHDLLRFGGSCPHCMLEIPGEEAPTDPGEAMRAKQQAEAAQKQQTQRTRSSALMAVAGLVIAGIFGGGAWYYVESSRPIEIDLEEYYVPPLQLAASAGGESGGEKPPESAGKTDGGKPDAGKSGGKPDGKTDGGKPDAGKSGGKDPASALASANIPQAGNAAAALGSQQPESGMAAGSVARKQDAVPEGLAMSTTSGSATVGIKGMPGASNAALSDSAEMSAMASRVIAAYSPQLDACAQQRLKQDPQFQGAWRLSVTIAPEGKVKSVAVKPQDKADAEFEQCVSRRVETWKFQPVVKDVTFNKTLRFGGGGW